MLSQLSEIKLTCEDMRGEQSGKFCVKIFLLCLHYTDIAIFALGYFTLPHTV